MKRRSSQLLLGIEAGGTRTVALLTTIGGKLIQRLEAGPANLQLLSDQQLFQHLHHIARALPEVGAVGIGMAGVRTPKDHARLRTLAARVWRGVPCSISSDLETALNAGGAKPGTEAQVLVLSGTGSCCYGKRADGTSVRVGGWGHILGDEGSGYDIALRALRAVLMEFDTGQWPRLGERLLRELLLNEPNELIPWIRQVGKEDVARLAPTVFSAWKSGDRLARRIIVPAAEALARDALACAVKLAGARKPVRFVFAGSVLLKQPKFAALVRTKLSTARPGSAAITLARESAWGAVALAKRALGAIEPIGVTEIEAAKLVLAARHRLIPVSARLSPTEERNSRSMNLDRLSLRAAVRLMIAEDRRVPGALLREAREIERAVALIAAALRRGGRLVYVGAGTSGRLGVLDASECPPTFRADPEAVHAIMAGGQTALWRSVEGAEDDYEAGSRAVEFRGVSRRDVIVGIAASGRTPFVWGALNAARTLGTKTIFICFNPHLRFPAGTKPDVLIAPRPGPELLTGSTRLKAGTATKLLLNMFTTLAMVKLGKVVGNLMVDLNPSNGKLRERAVRIVRQLTEADETVARQALEASGWVVKTAVRRMKARRRNR